MPEDKVRVSKGSSKWDYKNPSTDGWSPIDHSKVPEQFTHQYSEVFVEWRDQSGGPWKQQTLKLGVDYRVTFRSPSAGEDDPSYDSQA